MLLFFMLTDGAAAVAEPGLRAATEAISCPLVFSTRTDLSSSTGRTRGSVREAFDMVYQRRMSRGTRKKYQNRDNSTIQLNQNNKL
jgi:hypothetical protein